MTLAAGACATMGGWRGDRGGTSRSPCAGRRWPPAGAAPRRRDEPALGRRRAGDPDPVAGPRRTSSAASTTPGWPSTRARPGRYDVTGADAGGTLDRHRRGRDRTTSRAWRPPPVRRTEPTGDQVVDYYAQDRHGNVWWFGREGVWRAGEDGAEAGLAMPATPRVGDGWRAAYDAGVVDVRTTVATRDQADDHAGRAVHRPGRPRHQRRARARRRAAQRSTRAASAWSRRSRPPGPSTSPSCRSRHSRLSRLRRAELGGLGARVRLPRLPAGSARAAVGGPAWAGVASAALRAAPGPAGRRAATAPAASTPGRRGPTASRPG